MNSTQDPGILRYVIGFLVVGACWGLTTPFMRRAAINTRAATQTTSPRRKGLLDLEKSGIALARRAGSRPETVIHGSARHQPVRKRSLLFDRRAGWCVTKPCADDLLTGSELSLTVPITNSLAFLFTVLGEWIAEGKSISKGTANLRAASRLTFPDTWIGMALVLSGIAICVRSKN